mmetsp:Transcript_19075/g.21639  ORF Transcript_19075/g.21639 Transcript_19075/m.21639 type:complete len:163 (+) Transcript_19075:365-853(+)
MFSFVFVRHILWIDLSNNWIALTMKNVDDIHGFNVACHRIVKKSMHFFIKTCLAGDTSKDACFWYQVYRGIVDMDNMMLGPEGIFTSLPDNLKSNQNGMYMILENVVLLVEKWMTEESAKLKLEWRKANVDDEQVDAIEERNRKVNRFVGFALSSIVHRKEI